MTNTAITDLLQDKSNIKGTPFEELINNTIGYFFELIEEETQAMKEGCHLTTAEGKYLDLHGVDLDIKRLPNETDEEYRNRLIFLPLDILSLEMIYTVYNLQLLSYHNNSTNLTLLSDNHFANNKYYIDCSDEVWEQLKTKYMTNGILYKWSE